MFHHHVYVLNLRLKSWLSIFLIFLSFSLVILSFSWGVRQSLIVSDQNTAGAKDLKRNSYFFLFVIISNFLLRFVSPVLVRQIMLDKCRIFLVCEILNKMQSIILIKQNWSRGTCNIVTGEAKATVSSVTEAQTTYIHM